MTFSKHSRCRILILWPLVHLLIKWTTRGKTTTAVIGTSRRLGRGFLQTLTLNSSLFYPTAAPVLNCKFTPVLFSTSVTSLLLRPRYMRTLVMLGSAWMVTPECLPDLDILSRLLCLTLSLSLCLNLFIDLLCSVGRLLLCPSVGHQFHHWRCSSISHNILKIKFYLQLGTNSTILFI